jgi:exonuclease VII small subunit
MAEAVGELENQVEKLERSISALEDDGKRA